MPWPEETAAAPTAEPPTSIPLQPAPPVIVSPPPPPLDGIAAFWVRRHLPRLRGRILR
ncbi:hypothetical protein ACFVYR_25775 [Streptomyces sp. NPDC058284]|uniref:hypothetical protein n=1 Tax=unclassified Streptomyces TaxID=2593676 RepID=UPI00366945C4